MAEIDYEAVAAACDLTLPALLTLIVDEMTGSGDASASAVLKATAPLHDAQRAEVLRFVDWLRYRDSAPAKQDAVTPT